EAEHLDEGDSEALPRRAVAHKIEVIIIYDIVHSPSYNVPVLYITLSPRSDGATRSLDAVYDLLVPQSQWGSLQSVSVMGGLSMTDHPVTTLPAYFVHPCRTAEAMAAVTAGRTVTPTEYLVVWLGLIGSTVGLHMPVSVAKAVVQRNTVASRSVTGIERTVDTRNAVRD
ncbi:hypothetical protein BAUCODRAFT_79865, partial [Baudoinia panamericana UAMH 10762]